MQHLPIASAEKTRQILQTLNFSPHKSMGQNFLISAEVIKEIEEAAELPPQAKVLEIGAGLGALSEILAQKAAALTLLELDGRLCLHLQRLFYGDSRVEVIDADALSFDYPAHAQARGWQEYQIVANLPYYITSPILRRLLLFGGPWQSLTLMVQLEVAQKLIGPGGGPLSLLARYFGLPKLAFRISPDNFFPPPEIHSAVLKIERHQKPPFELDNPLLFESFLNAAFSQRRKTLLNSLSGSYGGEKTAWCEALKACQIPENIRAEQLSLEGFGALYALAQLQHMIRQ